MDKAQVIGAVKSTMATQGWKFIELAIQDTMVKDIDILTAMNRPEAQSDDFIRGRIDFAKQVLRRFKQEIAEFETNQRMLAEGNKEPESVGNPYTNIETTTVS